MSTLHGGRVFTIARERGWDWREVLDFSASISPLGPSPLVLEAIRSAVGEIAHYPESHPCKLIEGLSSAWNVNPDEILLGNGATELVHFLGRRFCSDPVTLCVPVFSEFHRVFPEADLIPVAQPDRWPITGVTVITRPVNPTGELPHCEEWLARTSHPVVVDESFIEFSGEPSVTGLIATRPNLFVLRSLTKFYAIPGLRVGALVAAPNLIARWKALRDPWSVNILAIHAACAAIADRDHGRRSLEVVRAERVWMARQLSALEGVAVGSSSANFLFAQLPYDASALTAFLEDRRLLIRNCTGWPGVEGANSVRVAIRTRSDNERLIAAWKEFACES